MTMTLRRLERRRYPSWWPNPMVCVCPLPDYGGRLVGCLTCGRPPYASARAEYGFATTHPDWKDT